jgi:hypothetical protein
VVRGGVGVVGEVTSLEVEDALALVTTDERLITIVAQPLPAALLLLGRGQADGNKSLYLVFVGVVFLSILDCF